MHAENKYYFCVISLILYDLFLVHSEFILTRILILCVFFSKLLSHWFMQVCVVHPTSVGVVVGAKSQTLEACSVIRCLANRLGLM